MAEGASRCVVRRLRWTELGGRGHLRAYQRQLPGAFPVAAFDDLPSARADCRRRELAARRGLNPFSLGGAALFHRASLDSGRLHDWLLDHGVIHPPHGADWRTWFYNASAILSPEQITAVWDALDKLRFYDVVEQPARSAHVVLRLTWHPSVQEGVLVESDCEGGQFAGAYRSRDGARAAQAEVSEIARREAREPIERGTAPGLYEIDRLMGEWPEGGLNVDEVPMADLAEVPMLDDMVGPAGFLVQRRAVDREGRFCPGAFVPLSLHGTREAAEAEARRLERQARDLVSPFAFFPARDDLGALSSLGFEQFQAEAQRLMLPAGARGRGAVAGLGGPWADYRPDAWLTLWDECVDEMPDARREAVWGLLDRLSFHQAVEVALAD